MLKRIILSTLLMSSMVAAQTNVAQQDIAIFVRPYNVVWKNNTTTICKHIGSFIANHKMLSTKLILTTSLLPEGTYLYLKGRSLPHYYALFDRTNPTGEIKRLAEQMVLGSKDRIEHGCALIEKLKETYHITCITSQTEAFHQKINERFPFFDTIVSKENDESYQTIHDNCSAKIMVLILPMNAKPSDIQAAEKAGFHLIFFDKNDPDAADARLWNSLISSLRYHKP